MVKYNSLLVFSRGDLCLHPDYHTAVKVKRGFENMKLNEPGRYNFIEWNCWYQANHAMIYSDLIQFDSSGFSTVGT